MSVHKLIPEDWINRYVWQAPTAATMLSSDMKKILDEERPEDKTKMRALLKGLVYTGGGRLAHSLVFGPPPEHHKAAEFLIREALRGVR